VIIGYFQNHVNKFRVFFRNNFGRRDNLNEVPVYDNIVKKAKDKEISINSIEKEALLSRGSVCKWNSVSPSVKNLKKVADILGCTTDDLLTTENIG
jgi:hypothetical protein